MDSRASHLKGIRPTIASAKVTSETSNGEFFQNVTLRPIIKLQNSLFVEAFKNYIRKHKDSFYDLSLEGKLSYIEKAIQKDIKFRNSLKGMIIGHFTIDEYKSYIQNSSALNKRMMNMVIERLKDQVQLLQKEVLV